VFARVDFRRRRSFAHPIGKKTEKMSKIIILIFKSAKAKGQGGSGEYDGSAETDIQKDKRKEKGRA
jgi:hypothetical protein